MLPGAYLSWRLGSLMRASYHDTRAGKKKRTRPGGSSPVLLVGLVDRRVARRRATGGRLVDLADEEDRDDERVDDERLDEREAEDHRREQLARGARVAGHAVERGRRGAALAERAAERGDADAEAGGE